ncbi:hypothetical protein PhCBS80983_g00058 [Powellomyces hirtus]|uniref:Uncharacterized protein n=1 Tax=Powellomyces hirtus TaxID=109895 RepID=A0A507EGF5_9FUNG|nr:hypothetical protein PhCBS80983_g00058 [Powellomyces hirtus]
MSQREEYSNTFKFTSIPSLSALSANPKNVQSTFLKIPSQHISGVDEAIIEKQPDVAFSDVLVIHAGSRNLRLGRASDAFPKEVPHLIVRKVYLREEPGAESKAPIDMSAVSDSFTEFIRYETELLAPVQEDLKQRMREQKIRSVPNAHSQVVGYNEQIIPESIPDHNDPYKIDWTEVTDEMNHIVGLKALRLASLKTTQTSAAPGREYQFRAFYPIQHGLLNVKDYTSARACMADMQTIWTESIESELEIPRKEFPSYNVVWVVPDLFSKVHLREAITMLLQEMCFRGVTVLQESVAATFGAGITTACVLDIGAQKTSVACVEDGMCVAATRVNLKYGGDDVTAFLMKLLSGSSFPYKDFDPKLNAYDWLLADELKEKFCTFHESEMMVNLCDFYVRTPDRPTSLHRMKVYDEVLLAPRALFHPQVIDFGKKLKHIAFEETYLDIDAEEEGNGDELSSEAMAANLVAYRTYIQSPDKFTNGHLKRKQSASLNVEMVDAAGMMSGSTTPERSKRLKKDAGGGSDADVVLIVQLDATKPDSTGNVNNILEPQPEDEAMRDLPLTHFLRRRRAIGMLKDVSMPLNDAVAQSFSLYASSYPEAKEAELESRIKKLCSSILVVGGGALITGLGKQLEVRVAAALQATVLKKRLDSLSSNNFTSALIPRVLQNPRDIDSRVLVWKGGAVFGKLDMCNDLWIRRRNWENGGMSGSIAKLMFPWD